MVDPTLVKEDVHGYRVCVIPGGLTDTRAEAAYRTFRNGNIDYLVTATRNGREVGRKLLERGVPERKLLIPDDSYFPYSSVLGDLTGAKGYLERGNIFKKIDLTNITTESWCAPRILITAWRLGYPHPRWLRAEDPRPIFSRKGLDIGEEPVDLIVYATIAMINPDFYLHSIEPRLQKLRKLILRF